MLHVKVVLWTVGRPVLPRGCLPAGCVGSLYIEAPDPLRIGIQDHRRCRVSIHTSGICIEEFPALEISLSTRLGKIEKRVDLIVDHRRIEQSHERELAAKDIPPAENRA